MNTNKLVSFAFASKRRKLAVVTAGVVGLGASALGLGDKPASEKKQSGTVLTTVTTAAVVAPVEEQPATVTTAAVVTTIPAGKCDGIHFNVPVAAGDPRDRDHDGIACEKN